MSEFLKIISDDTVELTDENLLDLSEKIANARDLRILCAKLNFKDSFVVEGYTNSYRQISEAAYQLISGLLKTQDGRITAYNILCEALKSSGLNFLVNEIRK